MKESKRKEVASVGEVKSGSVVVELNFDNVFNIVFYTILVVVGVSLAIEGTLVEELLKAALFAEALRRVGL